MQETVDSLYKINLTISNVCPGLVNPSLQPWLTKKSTQRCAKKKRYMRRDSLSYREYGMLTTFAINFSQV